MKILSLLSFVVMVAACHSQSDNTDAKEEARFNCMKTATECENDCHHIGGTNGEQYDCNDKCKINARKCHANQ